LFDCIEIDLWLKTLEKNSQNRVSCLFWVYIGGGGRDRYYLSFPFPGTPRLPLSVNTISRTVMLHFASRPKECARAPSRRPPSVCGHRDGLMRCISIGRAVRGLLRKGAIGWRVRESWGLTATVLRSAFGGPPLAPVNHKPPFSRGREIMQFLTVRRVGNTEQRIALLARRPGRAQGLTVPFLLQ
jgi:hypothetical protein